MFLCELMSLRPYQNCLNAALRLLARRDHSCMELIRKLKQRGFGSEHIQPAIAECRRLNYLDDDKFAHLYTLQLQHRGYGPRRIRQMLAGKGIVPQLISDTLNRNCHETKELSDCHAALIKKLKALCNEPKDGVPKGRLYRFLTGRGFSPAIIRRTLDDVLSSEEHLFE
jgi:regulatory protein